MSKKPFPFSVCKECCENEIKELHAKDITYTGEYYEDEPNVEDAINYIGANGDKLNRNIFNNTKDILAIKEDVEAHTTDIATNKTNIEKNATDIGLLREDLASRPTAEEEKQAITDVENIDKRVDELEEQTRESFVDLDGQIQANKAAADVALVNLEQKNCNMFANALKGSATGEAIALKDTSPVEHIIDVKVRKKNLLSFPYKQLPVGVTEAHGLTFTVDNQGVITINGTATANMQYILAQDRVALPAGLKHGDKITLSKNSNDTAQGINFTCNYIDANGTQQTGLAAGAAQTATATISDKWVGYLAYLWITKDKVYNNFIIKPQIELGSVATGWSPYLAEDISTVKLNVLGKNLIDVFGRTKGTMSGYDASNKRTFEFDKYYVGFSANNYYSPNGITAELTETGEWQITGTQAAYGVSFPIKVCPNTEYIGSANRSGGYFSITFYDKEGAYIKHVTAYSSFTVPDNCYTALLNIAPELKNTMTTYSNIQIELGSTATEYEPYKEPVMYLVGKSGELSLDAFSIYPNMTLLTDTVGAVIDVTYNKDSNKVIEKLTNAIIALGGNI